MSDEVEYDVKFDILPNKESITIGPFDSKTNAHLVVAGLSHAQRIDNIQIIEKKIRIFIECGFNDGRKFECGPFHSSLTASAAKSGLERALNMSYARYRRDRVSA